MELKDNIYNAGSLVLHMFPRTFPGEGSWGPLSLCPDVKYSQPLQKPAKVVFILNGILPITRHFWASS